MPIDENHIELFVGEKTSSRPFAFVGFAAGDALLDLDSETELERATS